MPFWVTWTLTLTSDLIFSFFSYLEHISFITYNFPQMCLMLDLSQLQDKLELSIETACGNFEFLFQRVKNH